MEQIKSVQFLYDVLQLMEIDINLFMDDLHSKVPDTLLVHESIAKIYYYDKACDSIETLSNSEVWIN
ncbi:hypothetical protein [Aquimarina megaterium]|uniref:hypothetical protein n=1 Tax=Aquimarina megaterium TaxID=1443666 RepID=UPI000470B825|nr:hypothetical protein [Aquimarina megaterium]